MKEYRATKRLERLIMDNAPAHYACADAPDTLDGLIDWYHSPERGEAIPVYDGGCDQTIFSSPAVNHAFRAIHDWAHIALHESGQYAGFDDEGERNVCAYTRAKFFEWGSSPEDLRAIYYDIVGQLEYCKRHGEFPNNQAAFIAACFDYGIPEAINNEY